MSQPFFTVFTPTYNRAHTLPRVYECLCAQTYTNFEWLIVDDGSTDNTFEIVKSWIDVKIIAVRYLRQDNAGKHVAFNRGVENAKGELFVPLDSDDTCIPQTLARFYERWHAIPKNMRSTFSGITCLCNDENGNIVGGPLPNDIIDGRFYDVLSKLNRTGEMWGFHRTTVLREFPFPIFLGEKFVPEGLVWNRIAGKYNMRFINEPLRHYYASNDALSLKMAKIRADSPMATISYYKEFLNTNTQLASRMKTCINIWRFCIQSNNINLITDIISSRPLIFLPMFLPGLAMALKDMIWKDVRGEK